MKTNGLTTGGAAPAAPPKPIISPEALRDPGPGKRWSVKQGPGSMSFDAAALSVPHDPSDAARHIRIHELLHARVTERGMLERFHADGRSWNATQACEDGRLGAIAAAQGISDYTTTSPVDPTHAAKMIGALIGLQTSAGTGEPGDGGGHLGAPAQVLPTPLPPPNYHEAACLAVAAWGTALWPVARDMLRLIPDTTLGDPVRDTVTQAVHELRAAPNDPDSALRAARIVDRLRILEPGDSKGDDDTRDGGPHTDGSSEGFAGCEADPAAVHIERPPLTERAARSTARVRRRSVDGGRLTRPAETLQPDGGAPFTRHRRVPGGVVVIDVSGSMHPTHEEITQLVREAPAALVVTYSSRTRGSGRNKKVVVTVVGEKGRTIAPERLSIGGGNMNDASVLAWADKHGTPGPRVWVSDGEAGNRTGDIDQSTVLYTEGIRRRLGYTRVASVPEALASKEAR